jgi:hypothetical protein
MFTSYNSIAHIFFALTLITILIFLVQVVLIINTFITIKLGTKITKLEQTLSVAVSLLQEKTVCDCPSNIPVSENPDSNIETDEK